MSSDNLPYAADAESPLKEAELEVLRRQYDREGQYVSIQTKFNYAWGLIKSDKAIDQRYGVKLLTGNYKLGNYAEARKYNDLLLEKENKNMQAMSLKGLIEDRVAKEGMLGVAILSGVVIAAGVMGSFLYKGLTKRSL
ncbi:mitochondrial membrane protein [Orbilia oligospora]|uniref:Mitochondrial fission 1 protein n=1 Tax=Orbilia oligospora TaxID=2813651 RepID=A0A8H8USY3_ORBOL|nr:mitochondrial membrane protein [Orbilia oligospora]